MNESLHREHNRRSTGEPTSETSAGTATEASTEAPTTTAGAPNIAPAAGQRLRALRERHGLTQVELAERSGLTQSHISALERGRSPLGLRRAKRLADALGVHPMVLLFDDRPGRRGEGER